MADKRACVLIDRQVQFALARRIVTHWCLFFALSLTALFGVEYVLADPSQAFSSYVEVIWGKYAFFILLMLAVIPTFVYDTIKLSNRFVGPIVRLRRSIRSLADGDTVPELRFREGDFWRELSDDFNRVASRLEHKSVCESSERQCIQSKQSDIPIHVH